MIHTLKLGRRAAFATLLAGFGFAFAARVSAQQPAPIPPPPMAPPGEPHHPMLREADRALLHARDSLFRAEHHFAGHRERAIQFIDEALREVHAAWTMPG